MSLSDEFREGFYDSEHKPQLAYAKSYFLEYGDKDPDLEGLENFYLEWRDRDEYMVIQKQTESLKIEGEVVVTCMDEE